MSYLFIYFSWCLFLVTFQDVVQKAFSGRKTQLLCKKFNVEIRRKDILTLADQKWVNDEVINFYFNLIMERAEKKSERYPSVHAFKTYFFPVLSSRGFDDVKKWTSRVDIFAKDLLLIPIHLGNHWAIVVVDMRKKILEFYDSMGSERFDLRYFNVYFLWNGDVITIN